MYLSLPSKRQIQQFVSNQKPTQACQTALQFESRSSIQFFKFMGIVLIQQMDLFELTAAKTPEYDKSVIVSPYVGDNTQRKKPQTDQR